MPPSKSLNAYSDVKLVLDHAVAQGGFSFRLRTSAKAINFKARVYNYLRLWRQHERERLGHVEASKIPPTPYDNVLTRIDGKDPCVLHMSIRDLEFLEGATDLEGNPLSISITVPEPSPDAEDLEASVLALAREAGLDLD